MSRGFYADNGVIYNYIRLSFSCVLSLSAAFHIPPTARWVIKSPAHGCNLQEQVFRYGGSWLKSSCRARILPIFSRKHPTIVSLKCDFSCICNPATTTGHSVFRFMITVFVAAAVGWAPGCKSRSSAGWSPRAWLASPSAPVPRGRARQGGSTCSTWWEGSSKFCCVQVYYCNKMCSFSGHN